MTGTWCTPEIEKAVRLGYKITKIYEVYHWEKSIQYDPKTHKGGLFAQYINTFLKFKQEASGPPKWIKCHDDMNKYIGQYMEKKGSHWIEEIFERTQDLELWPNCVSIAFGESLVRDLICDKGNFSKKVRPTCFFQLFSDPLKQPIDFHILPNDTIQVEWHYKNDCQPEDNKTNIYLATFTTCWARLKLYSVLEQLGRRVLYYDTDSIIYVCLLNEYDPPLGDYLGELTNELQNGEHIVEFVSGGPKNYAYKTNENNETYKVRGFTLNFKNSQLINFHSVKDIITDP